MDTSWPPNYILRESPRARRVRLQICRTRGLILVVPKKFNQQEIPGLLQKHEGWIKKHLSNISLLEQPEALPEKLNLRALNEVWTIQYEPSPKRVFILENHIQELHIFGDTQNKAAIKKVILKWVLKKAEKTLLVWLNRLSQENNLVYQSASVRYAKTRWGSCSGDKKISLNARLLFLPPELVEHVIIHELCHLKHLDHSPRFWRLFESLNENCQLLRKQIRTYQVDFF